MSVQAHSADPDLLPADEEIAVIQRLKRGDREAAATLYRWYGTRLFRQVIYPRLPVRELAEDALKDTFRTTLEKIESFEHRGISIFFWMRRIAINRVNQQHRHHKKQRAAREDSTYEEATIMMADPPAAPDRRQDALDAEEMVNKSLDRLNPRYARALRMRFIEEVPRKECARRMRLKLNTFDVLLHRAVKAFREEYPP